MPEARTVPAASASEAILGELATARQVLRERQLRGGSLGPKQRAAHDE